MRQSDCIVHPPSPKELSIDPLNYWHYQSVHGGPQLIPKNLPENETHVLSKHCDCKPKVWGAIVWMDHLLTEVVVHNPQ